MAAVEIDAPAKVNLRLRILAPERSGYHSLESLFCAIDLADAVRVEQGGDGIELQVEGKVDTGPPERNLAVRAAGRFLEEVGAPREGLRILLRKRIPSAAGLGGGSSDAAATLRALNQLYGAPLPDERLLQLGIELGSDVPFFLGGSALALGWGRGERLLTLPPLPTAPVLVANPGAPMPTAEAFRAIAERRGGEYAPLASRLRLEEMSTWDGIAAIAGNDFAPVARAAQPRVAAALEILAASGATIALLAGSGVSVFGVYPGGGAEIDGAEERLRTEGCATWRAHTLASLPEPRKGPPGTG
jgi:4-diphosphocytidyl-2-C-methyl-D-erythritol kinase